METNDEKIGYLLSKTEELKSDQERIERKVDALTDLVKVKFNTAETFLKALKFLGLAVLAVLTFKFGDVTRLWHHFFS